MNPVWIAPFILGFVAGVVAAFLINFFRKYLKDNQHPLKSFMVADGTYRFMVKAGVSGVVLRKKYYESYSDGKCNKFVSWGDLLDNLNVNQPRALQYVVSQIALKDSATKELNDTVQATKELYPWVNKNY